jgi:hypothetical protein
MSNADRLGLVVLVILLWVNGSFFVDTFRTKSEISMDRPILIADATTVDYLMVRARQFDADAGRLWGYDPSYCAGYPDAFVWNSCLPLHLAARAFPEASTGRVYKYFYLTIGFAIPLILFIIALGAGAGIAGSSLALWPMLLYVWHGEPANVMFAGNVASLTGYLFSVLTFVFFERFLKKATLANYLPLLILAPLTPMIHKLSVVILAFPLIFSLLFYFRPKKILWPGLGLLALLALSVAANAFWLSPMLALLKYKIIIQAIPSWASPGIENIAADFGLGGRNGAKLLLLLIGIGGLLACGKRKRYAGIFVAALYFFAFAYLGGDLELTRDLTPYRHIVAAFFILIVPVGALLGLLVKKLAKYITSVPAYLVVGGAMLIVSLPAALMVDLTNSYAVLFKMHPLSGSSLPNNNEIIDRIERLTTREGRILIEDVNPRLVVQDNTFFPFGPHMFASLLGVRTNREFIGGPYPRMSLVHHYVDFQNGVFLGKPLADYGESELDEAFRTYNIKWIVSWFDKSQQYFDAAPDKFKLIDQIWPIKFYELDREPSFFLEGGGKALSEPNHIYLSEVTAPSGQAVIAYHWFEGLRTNPRRKIKQVRLGDDPVGFIGIDNPPPEIEIYNSYLLKGQ